MWPLALHFGAGISPFESLGEIGFLNGAGQILDFANPFSGYHFPGFDPFRLPEFRLPPIFRFGSENGWQPFQPIWRGPFGAHVYRGYGAYPSIPQFNSNFSMSASSTGNNDYSSRDFSSKSPSVETPAAPATSKIPTQPPSPEATISTTPLEAIPPSDEPETVLKFEPLDVSAVEPTSLSPTPQPIPILLPPRIDTGRENNLIAAAYRAAGFQLDISNQTLAWCRAAGVTPQKAPAIFQEWRKLSIAMTQARQLENRLQGLGIRTGRDFAYALMEKLPTLSRPQLLELQKIQTELKKINLKELMKDKQFEPAQRDAADALQRQVTQFRTVIDHANLQTFLSPSLETLMNKIVLKKQPGDPETITLANRQFTRTENMAPYSNETQHTFALLSPEATQADVEQVLRQYTKAGQKEEAWTYVEYEEGGQNKKAVFECGEDERKGSVSILTGLSSALLRDPVKKITLISQYHTHPMENEADRSAGKILQMMISKEDLQAALETAHDFRQSDHFTGILDFRIVTQEGLYQWKVPDAVAAGSTQNLKAAIKTLKDKHAQVTSGQQHVNHAKLAEELTKTKKIQLSFTYIEPIMGSVLNSYYQMENKAAPFQGDFNRATLAQIREIKQLLAELKKLLNDATTSGVSNNNLKTLKDYVQEMDPLVRQSFQQKITTSSLLGRVS